MPIPAFPSIMRPMLEVLSDGSERTPGELRDLLSDPLGVTVEDRQELLPSTGKVYDNRVAWAYVHLYHAGLIARPRRAVYAITDRGRVVLAETPGPITEAVIRQFPEYREWRKPRRRKARAVPAVAEEEQSTPPLERMGLAAEEMESALTHDLLERIAEQDWSFFEQVVLNVIVKMGYGSGLGGQQLGGVGDEGVDAVVDQDKLGLDRIYLQAKKWTNTVQRPDIQAFVGALTGKMATKGVFITTSQFWDGARRYVEGLPQRVVLIDGEELAELMIRNGVGVRTTSTFEVKEVDEDYFLAE